MTHVELIVTGRMEKLALSDTLSKVIPNCSEITWNTQRVDGFTSNALPDEPQLTSASGVSSKVLNLAKRLVFAADPGRTGEPVDLAIAIDDLELANSHQPEVVVHWLAEAVEHTITHAFPSQRRKDQCRERVREKCSFHLLVPMAETYFYGEKDALHRAGCLRKAILKPNIDLEFFKTNDPNYIAKLSCSKSTNYARHPKKYISFLCEPNKYKETRNGVNALKSLNWESVLQFRENTKYIRSFFDDLFDGLDRQSPFPGELHHLTRRCENGLLRNIKRNSPSSN